MQEVRRNLVLSPEYGSIIRSMRRVTDKVPRQAPFRPTVLFAVNRKTDTVPRQPAGLTLVTDSQIEGRYPSLQPDERLIAVAFVATNRPELRRPMRFRLSGVFLAEERDDPAVPSTVRLGLDQTSHARAKSEAGALQAGIDALAARRDLSPVKPWPDQDCIGVDVVQFPGVRPQYEENRHALGERVVAIVRNHALVPLHLQGVQP